VDARSADTVPRNSCVRALVFERPDRSSEHCARLGHLEGRLAHRPALLASDRQAIQVSRKPVIEPTQVMELHMRRFAQDGTRVVQDGRVFDVLLDDHRHDQAMVCHSRSFLSTSAPMATT
jgi:hypothetical protein